MKNCGTPGCEGQGSNICIECHEYGCNQCYIDDCFHEKKCSTITPAGARNRALIHIERAKQRLDGMDDSLSRFRRKLSDWTK